MKIKYVVSLCENCAGRLHEIKRKEFGGVDLAIVFHSAQANGTFSWWEITVEYERKRAVASISKLPFYSPAHKRPAIHD